MELYSKQLLNILNGSLNEEDFISNSQEVFDWEKIILEAEKHKISSLIYYLVGKEVLNGIKKEILNKWKANIFKSNIKQMHYLNNVKEILLGLEKKGVKVIALKGVILKNFYPRPEFRTMDDLDILIEKKDYGIVNEYLNSIGYTCKESKGSIHALFYSNNRIDVEVHWKLVNDQYYMGDKKEFEENIWGSTKEINIFDLKFTTLNDEDFLIHMCMHMAVHAKCKGFGLRHLYDLALFTKNKYEDIDWANFKDRINRYGILKFTEGLYAICYKLFKIKVPYFELKSIKIDDIYINLLLENIIYFGVNTEVGKENLDFSFAYEQINFYNKAKKIAQLTFQKRKELLPEYVYVEKRSWLLPVAWLHRIFRVIKKNGFRNIFNYMKQAIVVKDKKKEIIDIFNL